MSADGSRGRRVVRLIMMVALVLVLGATERVAPGQAQPPSLDGPLGPDDCVRIALERNLEVLIAGDQLEQARGISRQALSGVLPSISASASYSFDQVEGPYIDGQGNISIEKTNYNTRNARVSLDQTLFNWSSLQNLRSARSSARASYHDVAATELDVALRVKSRYYEFLKARRLHEVRLESVDLGEQQLNRAQTLFDVGSVAKNDVLQARVNLQQTRLQEIQARNLVELEQARLAQLMGVVVITEFEIIDDLEMSPGAAIDSMEVWREAMAARPDLRAARLRLQAGELEVSAARGGRYPNLFTQVSRSLSETEVLTKRWSVVAGVSLNIFDGMLTEGRIKSAKAARVVDQDRLRQLELVAALEIKEAILGIREAQQSIAATDEAVGLAEENLNLAQERYKLGSGTLLELEEAQVALIDARRTLVESQALLKVAEASLDKARGRSPR